MSVVRSDRMVVAAFDFDGTLTRRDTLLPFLIHLLGCAKVIHQALFLAPTLVGYALGMIRNDVAKERVFSQCLGGMEIDILKQEGELFAGQILPGLMRQKALQRLEWHRKQGHHCVAISASLELYVRPWAIRAGFDDVIATCLETTKGGQVTGKLSGANCYGNEKVRRLGALLGARDGYTLYAYGDSQGDWELLSLADYAYYRHIPKV